MIERPYGAEDADAEDVTRGAVLWARRGLGGAADSGAAVTDEDDAGSFLGAEVTLALHRADVETKATEFARACGLPERLVNTVARAALLHDDGKGDPRFQAYLTGGAAPDAPLAKSARWPRGLDRAARASSKLPERWRHEALSVRLAIAELDRGEDEAIDAELAVWLIGTHHGHGRPFFPHDDAWDADHRPVLGADGLQSTLGPAPGPQRLDFEWRGMDWTQLFEALKRRYGVWGLAYLEAIVRLADHRASEEEERKP